MDFGEIYHFLFETFPGMGCLIGIGLAVALVASVVLERRTRKALEKRKAAQSDEWAAFDEEAQEGD